MNPWQQAFVVLAAFAGGWFICDRSHAGQLADVTVKLQRSMLEYTGDTVAAQKTQADRVIASVVESSAARTTTRDAITKAIQEVQNAPDTTACVSSPAIALVLERLRGLTEAAARDRKPLPAP